MCFACLARLRALRTSESGSSVLFNLPPHLLFPIGDAVWVYDRLLEAVLGGSLLELVDLWVAFWHLGRPNSPLLLQVAALQINHEPVDWVGAQLWQVGCRV